MTAPPPLADTLAIVTGASRGIGLAVAAALRTAGAHVVRLARSLADGTGERETTLRCDVTRGQDVDRAVARVLDELGVPDIVVNNAGLFFVQPLADTAPGDFERAVATNLTGAFLVSRAFVPRMVAHGRGHLVTVGSVSDYRALPGSAAYGAAKYGLRGLHEVIAVEVARTGVRTTLISPGPVDTEMWDPIDPDTRPGFTRRADMLRADDVADAVVFAVTRPPRVVVTELRLMPAISSPRAE